MSDDSSEEKTLPASDKKLDDARKKGQVALSSDFVSALSLLAGTLCLYVVGASSVAAFSDALILSLGLQDRPLVEATARLVPALGSASALVLVPLLVAVVVGALLASVGMHKGFIFSLEPMKPSFDKLNPVKGIRNIFKKKSLVELVKSLLKIAMLGAAFTIVVMGSLGSLVHIPHCGHACVVPTFVRLSAIIVGIALIFLVVLGAIDILLQRALFLEEMKMTKTEMKRETEDQDGKPEIKGELARQRQEAATEEPPAIANTSLVVYGPGVTAGLLYVPGITGVPVLVIKGRNERAGALLAEAHALGKPIVDDPVLAEMLVGGVGTGRQIKARHYDRVARAIQRMSSRD